MCAVSNEYQQLNWYDIIEDKSESVPEQEDIPLGEDESIIYARFTYAKTQNLDNGFCVFLYTTVPQEKDSKPQRVTCVGTFLPSYKNVTYALRGKWKKHKTYGEQFEVETYKEKIPRNQESIIEYLSSGIIKGIGKATAEKIYATFKDRTLDILDNDIEQLRKVKGIGKGSIKKIATSYQENRCARDLIAYGLRVGISSKISLKIFNRYSYEALRKLRTSPYEIQKNVRGISFLTADKIARMENLPLDTDERFESCFRYVFKEREVKGNLGITLCDFGNLMYKTLNSVVTTKDFINRKTVEFVEKQVLKIRKVVLDGDDAIRCIFLSETLKMEKECADNILRLSHADIEKFDVERAFLERQKANKIEFDELQKEAVIESLRNSFTIITGCPGTGKTTIIKNIVDIYKKECNGHVVCMAPTGRAARRMKESTGYDASTIHSYFHIRAEESYEEEDDVTIENALVIIDEFSMVDSYIASILFDRIGSSCRVVLVGDIDQLPSVGPGAVLRDCIDSGLIRTIRLSKIYRQNENNKIYLNAKKMREGDVNIEEGDDFKIFPCKDIKTIEKIMVEKTVEKIAEYGLGNVFCLCPYRKYEAGLFRMNEILQERINPASPSKNEIKANGMIFRVGDPVMHLKNEEKNDVSVSNGDLGFITEIINTKEDKIIKVEINGSIVEYEKDDFDTLILAYAMTIHKSQGSEAECVITCLCDFHVGMIYMNLPYTAFTRGKKEDLFIGDVDTLKKAILTRLSNKRITTLCMQLKYLSGEFIAA